jgi:hypothetical protein
MFVTLFMIGNSGCEAKHLDFEHKEVVVVCEKCQLINIS